MSLFDELMNITGEGVRGLALNLFPAFYDRGLSANQALKELQSQGIGYKRADFLADYRSNRPGYDLSTSVSRLNKAYIPNESILKPQYHGAPDKYSFVFKAVGEDTTNGEAKDQYFFMHRDSLDTRANMEQDAYDWISEQADAYGFEVSKISIKEGYINPVWVGGE